MQIIRSLSDVPAALRGGAATIGNFDGVHLGHQMLFSHLLRVKRELGLPTLAITFEPHPKSVLSPRQKPFHLLTTLEEKLSLLAQAGLDATIVIPFDKSFAAMTAEAFVRTVLGKQLQVRNLFIGHDYAFGKNKGGNAELLGEFARAGAFKLETLAAYQSASGGIVSSTAVRQAIARGDLHGVRQMLGRFYTIRGEVVRGEGRGTQIGFPTANIVPNKSLLPPQGVYATLVSIDEQGEEAARLATPNSAGGHSANGVGTTWGGALNIGNNPTFGGDHLSVEVFLIGYAGVLYGRKLTVAFVERIRGELAFASAAELFEQIKADVAQTEALLAAL